MMYNDFRYRILTEKRASKFYERPLAVSAQRRILVKHTQTTHKITSVYSTVFVFVYLSVRATTTTFVNTYATT